MSNSDKLQKNFRVFSKTGAQPASTDLAGPDGGVPARRPVPLPRPPIRNLKDLSGYLKGRVSRLLVKWSAKFLARELYRGIFRREADPDGLAFAVASIRMHGGIDQILRDLLSSAELRTEDWASAVPLVMESLYHALFARPADEGGMKIGVGYLQTPNDLANFLAMLIRSEEFKLKFGIILEEEKKYHRMLPVIQATRPIIGRAIVVSSNCVTGGIAAALQACFPADTVVPIPLPEFADPRKFVEAVSRADIWVSTDWRLWDQIRAPNLKPDMQLVKWPPLRFQAFHPDLCYVVKLSDGQVTAMRYNSAIAAWGYNRGLTTADTKKLFTRENYAALGYFGLWGPSINVMREGFVECDVDFGQFMLALKRQGVFMHSIDHPRVQTLVELAKLISLKLGAPESVINKSIDVSDALTTDIWPVYPEIADEYSLAQGSYDWKIWEKWIPGLDQYLEFAFGEYVAEKIPVGGMRLHNRDQAMYDRVLGPQVEKIQ